MWLKKDSICGSITVSNIGRWNESIDTNTELFWIENSQIGCIYLQVTVLVQYVGASIIPQWKVFTS